MRSASLAPAADERHSGCVSLRPSATTCRWSTTPSGRRRIWRLFNAAAIEPGVWGAERDKAAIQRAIAQDLPPVIDYLESQAPASGFRFGQLGLADIAVAVPFRNAAWARWTPDAARWPKATAWIGRVDAAQPLQAINAVADRLARTAPAQQPALARELGLAVTETRFGTVTPRRGPMTV